MSEEQVKRSLRRKEGASPVPTKKKRNKPHKSKTKTNEASVENVELEAIIGTESMDTDTSAFDSSNPGSLDSSMMSHLELSKDDTMDMSADPVDTGEMSASACSQNEDEECDLMCSFCACGKKSLLGQGDLTRYEPTPNFNPFKKTSSKHRRTSNESSDDKSGEKSPKHLTWRRARGPMRPGSRERSKSPRRPNPHSTTDEEGRPIASVDELTLVGLPEETDVYKVFESTGHTWAHHCCAAWSDGVIQADDYTLQKVDKAVFAGLSQKCNYCKRYGATIQCKYSKCTKKYHYPCASGGGCFQDIKTLSLLCPEHTVKAESIAGQEAWCVVCDLVGVVAEQLFCTSCGQHYHGNCLDPPVEVNPIVRAGWQCPECKICQTCRQPGDDNKMLVCDTCDKGYHTFCLKPVMTTIPKNGWKCRNCRSCGDCGSRTPGSGPSSRWHLNYSLCDSCYQQRHKGLSCPICGKAYRQFTQKDMVQCNTCKKYVHNGCDDNIDTTIMTPEEQEAYTCNACKNKDPNERADMEDTLTESLKSIIDETDLENIEGFGIFKESDTASVKDESYQGDEAMHSSQESLILDENSLSSMDIDINALEKGSTTFPSSQPSPQQPSPAPFSSITSSQHRPHGQGKGKPSLGKKKMKAISKAGGKKSKKMHSSHGEGRRKSKNKSGQTVQTQGANVPANSQQDDKSDDHHSTVVLTSSTDDFVLKQDMCYSCGSYGQDDEGKLIACTHCGQCYHPFCVSVKPTKIVQQKGWRCLDCTVCEGCGKPTDEGKLLLCDDCDISYHIYCLDPPLDHVPKGNWKCKWCVVCHTCGATTPGFGCRWQNNYTQCGKCASYIACPSCKRHYKEEELIIECTNCNRWLHTLCDGMKDEEDAERAADAGYQCLYCRAKTGHPPPPPPPPPPRPRSPSPITSREPDPPKPAAEYLLDGICLSESGMQQIKALTVPPPVKKRQRRPKQPDSFKHPHLAGIGQHGDKHTPTDDFIEGKEYESIMDEETKGLDENAEHTEGVPKTAEGVPLLPDKKKKPRKAFKPGIGGFLPRSKARTVFKKIPDPSKTEEGESRDVSPSKTAEGFDEEKSPEKPVKRKRRPKKKGSLDEMYPVYLQEAFFGKTLIEKGKKKELSLETSVDEIKAEDIAKKTDDGFTVNISPTTKSPPHRPSERSEGLHDIDEGYLKDLLPTDLLQHDDDIFGMLGGDIMGTHQDESDQTQPAEAKESAENLDMLSPDKDLDVDKMLRESLAQIDSKTVDELFKGVLGPDQNPLTSPSEGHFQLPPLMSPTLQPHGEGPSSTQGQLSHTQLQAQSAMSSPSTSQDVPVPSAGPLPVTGQSPSHIQLPSPSTGPLGIPVPPEGPGGVSPRPGSLPSFGMPPQGQMPQSPYGPDFGGQYSPGYAGPPNWPMDDFDDPHSGKRTSQKWESDEALGDKATISPVVYCNINHPELKTKYPEWSERVKQITKLWRKVPPDDKQPYLAKARANRANSKIAKAAKIQDFCKKQEGDLSPGARAAMLPPPLPTMQRHPEPMTQLHLTKAKFQEQERQWKHMQQIRATLLQEKKKELQMVPRGPEQMTPTSQPGTPQTPGTPEGAGGSMSPYGQPLTPQGAQEGQFGQQTSRPMDILTQQLTKPPNDSFPPASAPPRVSEPIIIRDPYARPQRPQHQMSDPFGRPDSAGRIRPEGPPGMPRPPDPYSQAPGTPFQHGAFPQGHPPPSSDHFGQPEGFSPRGMPEGFSQSPRPHGPPGEFPGGVPPRSMAQEQFSQAPGTPHPATDPSPQGLQSPVSRPDHPGQTSLQQMLNAGPQAYPPGERPPPLPQGMDPNSTSAALHRMFSSQRLYYLSQRHQQSQQTIKTEPEVPPYKPAPGQVPLMLPPGADVDGKQADVHRQQLRELLAKQTKERQKQKQIEEQEKVVGGPAPGVGMPLRHWGPEEMPPGQSDPASPAIHPVQHPGMQGLHRPPPGYPGQFRPRAPPPGDQHWDPQMQRHARPDMEGLGPRPPLPEMGMRGPAPHPEMGMRGPAPHPEMVMRGPAPHPEMGMRGPALHPEMGMRGPTPHEIGMRGPHPDMPMRGTHPEMGMRGPESMMGPGFPGPGPHWRMRPPGMQGPMGPQGPFPHGQYPPGFGPRHPHPEGFIPRSEHEMTAAERQRTPYLQMFRERLQKAKPTTPPIADQQSPQQQPSPRLPTPTSQSGVSASSPGANPLDPYDHIVRQKQQMQQLQQQQHISSAEQRSTHPGSTGRPQSRTSSPRGGTPYSTPPTTPAQHLGQGPHSQGHSPAATQSPAAASPVTQGPAQPQAPTHPVPGGQHHPGQGHGGPGLPDKPVEGLDDLLAPDGTFNIFEYADPELHRTLAEVHDKSMFDEHLGLKGKPGMRPQRKEQQAAQGEAAQATEQPSKDGSSSEETSADAAKGNGNGKMKTSDFQAQFLAFSRRLSEQDDDNKDGTVKSGEDIKTEKTEGTENQGSVQAAGETKPSEVTGHDAVPGQSLPPQASTDQAAAEKKETGDRSSPTEGTTRSSPAEGTTGASTAEPGASSVKTGVPQSQNDEQVRTGTSDGPTEQALKPETSSVTTNDPENESANQQQDSGGKQETGDIPQVDGTFTEEVKLTSSNIITRATYTDSNCHDVNFTYESDRSDSPFSDSDIPQFDGTGDNEEGTGQEDGSNAVEQPTATSAAGAIGDPPQQMDMLSVQNMVSTPSSEVNQIAETPGPVQDSNAPSMSTSLTPSSATNMGTPQSGPSAPSGQDTQPATQMIQPSIGSTISSSVVGATEATAIPSMASNMQIPQSVQSRLGQKSPVSAYSPGPGQMGSVPQDLTLGQSAAGVGLTAPTAGQPGTTQPGVAIGQQSEQSGSQMGQGTSSAEAGSEIEQSTSESGQMGSAGSAEPVSASVQSGASPEKQDSNMGQAGSGPGQMGQTGQGLPVSAPEQTRVMGQSPVAAQSPVVGQPMPPTSVTSQPQSMPVSMSNAHQPHPFALMSSSAPHVTAGMPTMTPSRMPNMAASYASQWSQSFATTSSFTAPRMFMPGTSMPAGMPTSMPNMATSVPMSMPSSMGGPMMPMATSAQQRMAMPGGMPRGMPPQYSQGMQHRMPMSSQHMAGMHHMMQRHGIPQGMHGPGMPQPRQMPPRPMPPGSQGMPMPRMPPASMSMPVGGPGALPAGMRAQGPMPSGPNMPTGSAASPMPQATPPMQSGLPTPSPGTEDVAQTAPGKERPALLHEQPLLLEDLVNQEKVEQQRQVAQQALMQKHEPGMMAQGDFENPTRPGGPGFPPRMMSPNMEPMQRLQHPEQQQQWPPGHPREGMFPPPYPGRPVGARAPSPFTQIPSPDAIPRPPPPMQGKQGQQPAGSAGEPLTEQERRTQMKYEEWLMQHAQLTAMQVKYLEQQIGKQRKTKKQLQNKSKQAKKMSQDLTPEENAELEKVNQEVSLLQKQLDQVRKQQKQHQLLIQEYRTKQQERYGASWPAPPPGPGAPMQGGSMQGGPMPMMPGARPPTPGQGHPMSPLSPTMGPPPSPLMQHSPQMPRAQSPSHPMPQPRMPGAAPSARLTAAQRQEYDQYMQSRLRMMGPGQLTTPIGQPPRPQPPSTSAVMQGPPTTSSMMAGPRPQIVKTDDNNPFSDTYIQRENAQKMQEKRHFTEHFDRRMEKSGLLTPEERQKLMQQVQMFGQQASGPEGQGQRFPRPPFPGPEGMRPRFPNGEAMRPRFPGDPNFPGPRLPHDNQVRREFPADQQPSPGGSQSPSMTMPLPPHYPVGEILADKPKKKRIRKKKKPVEPTTPTEPDTTQQTIDKILANIPKFPANNTTSTASPPKQQLYPIGGPITTPSVLQPGASSIRMPALPTGDGKTDPLKDAMPASEASKMEMPAESSTSIVTKSETETKDKEEDPSSSIIASVARGAGMISESFSHSLDTDEMDLETLSETPSTPPTRRTPNSQRPVITGSGLDEILEKVARGNLSSDDDEPPKPPEPPKMDTSEMDNKTLQNMLLKQLLAQGAKGGRRQSEDPDENIKLTPEQQRQLEMIDSMPFAMEREISQEEWDSMTEDEKCRIKEMRRQLQERQELLNQPAPAKRKLKKKKDKDGPKKRARKSKPTEDYQAYMQAVIQQLRNMPPLSLQQPNVAVNYNLCSPPGCNETVSGDSGLCGQFGTTCIRGHPDFYSHYPFTNIHPLPPSMPAAPPGSISRIMSDMAKRRHILGDPTAGGDKPVGEHPMRTLDGKQRFLGRGNQLSQASIPSPVPSPPTIGPRLEIPSRLSNTPDTIISSSSPEVGFDDVKDVKYPALKVIDPDKDREQHNSSPCVPILKPVPIKASAVKVRDESSLKTEVLESLAKSDQGISQLMKEREHMQELMDKQDSLVPKPSPLSALDKQAAMDTSLHDKQVSVTLTLSGGAANDIKGVISRLADLLKIAVPPSYEISRSPSPDMFRSGAKHKEEAINIQTLIKAKQKFCRHCDVVVLNNGIQKKVSEMPFLSKEDQENLDEDEVKFCSMNCYIQFTITHRTAMGNVPETKEASDLVEHKSILLNEKPFSLSSASATSTTTTATSAVATASLPPPVGVIKKEAKAVKSRRRSSSTSVEAPPPKPLVKKWKGLRYKYWDSKFHPKTPGFKLPTDTELYKLIGRLGIAHVPNPAPVDTRVCEFCHVAGDADTNGPGRLLNMDSDQWAHLNCALWSHEVYETLNGALMNVDQAYKRGLGVDCVVCKKNGATLGCYKARCTNLYHVGCAQKDGCMFFEDKTILCSQHVPKAPYVEGEFKDLTVFRRVYINRDEHKQIASIINKELQKKHAVRIGGVILHSIGQLLPHQIATGKFHTREFIYPVGFKTTRFYWSMRVLHKRCRYICTIQDKDGRPEFEVKVIETGYDEVTFKEPTPKDAWMHILDPLDKMRRAADLVKMFPAYLGGEDLFGLNEPTIMRVVESLPGTDLLQNYNFKFGRCPLLELPLAINPTGCARSEPKFRTHFRRPHTLHSSTKSHSLPSTVTGVTSDINSPYMKQFVHSKSQQYRRLKTEWRTLVFLARSRIQGLGLYAARDIEKHTMVIEYIGEIIRNEVSEKREKIYEDANRGIYMFRITPELVVDATMSGGLARYINHSCNPNCVAEVVPFGDEHKIIIIANKRIPRGEELCYDYKFDFEDEQHKIPCLCGAPNCRKWMN